MIKKINLFSLLAVLSGLALLADTVDEAQIIDFQAGSPACAADVNQTIQALVAAVNDNAARLAAIEVKQANSLNILEERISGSKYSLFSMATGLGSAEWTDNNPPDQTIDSVIHSRVRQHNYAMVGTLIVNSNRTSSLTLNGRNFGINLDSSFINYSGGATGVPGGVGVTPYDEPDISTLTGTWSFSDQILQLSFGADTLNLIVSPNGEMLMSGRTSSSDEPYSSTSDLSVLSSELLMGVQIAEPRITVSVIAGGGEEKLVSHDVPLEVTSSPTTFVINNAGNLPATVSEILPSNMRVNQPDVPLVIQPGGYILCDVIIRYSDTDAHVMKVVSNDPLTPEYKAVVYLVSDN